MSGTIAPSSSDYGTPVARSSPGRIDRATIAAIDREDMLGHILTLPQQLTDAHRRMARSELLLQELSGGLVVLGMGGSAIGADLAVAVIGSRARRPIRVIRDYSPDSWLGRDTLALCASYSGNTEETLEAFELAGRAGARRAVLTAGGELARAAEAEGVPVLGVRPGLRPRAAVAYMLVGVLEAARRCGASPDLGLEVPGTCRLLAALASEWGPDRDSEATRLASHVAPTTVIYGGGPTVPVAVRWKTQLNENAKITAFHGAIPEANHNEVCAWRDGGDGQQFVTVFLEAPDQHPRVRRRIALTAAMSARAGAHVERVEARGQTRLERTLSLVMLGDLMSVYRAVLSGVNPTPVEAIEHFKETLAET